MPGKSEPVTYEPSTIDEPPPWLNCLAFHRAQLFAKKHVFVLVMMMHFSLLSGLSVPNLLGPLVHTGMSDTPSKALKRYMATFAYVMTWYFSDMWGNPEGEGRKSIKQVRGMHRNAASSMNTQDDQRLYFSQYDMGLVQCGFMGAMMLSREQFGIKCSTSEIQDFLHFWRCIGYMLGVKDKYNICVVDNDGNPDYNGTYDICTDIQDKILLPNLRHPPKDFDHMADAYTAGMTKLFPVTLMTKESHLHFMTVKLGENFQYVLGLWDRFLVFLLHLTVFLIEYCPGFETLMNMLVMWAVTHQVKVKVEI